MSGPARPTEDSPGEPPASSGAPRLILVSTPIGNLEDLTLRARRVLGEVGALACEDTRVTRRIFERHGVPFPRIVFSYHEHNEERAGRKILDLLRQGLTVALCSNAGTPAVSDPGYRVTAAVLSEGFSVEVLPGPSAVTAALLASGLPTSSFTFKGFPPRKPGPRRRFLEMERESPHTLVFFESPLRLAGFLREALAAFGNRHAAVCIELTKMFERVRRGPLAALLADLEGEKIRGEVTVVVAGNHPKFIEEAPQGSEPGSPEVE